jgi:hypothetical protein
MVLELPLTNCILSPLIISLLFAICALGVFSTSRSWENETRTIEDGSKGGGVHVPCLVADRKGFRIVGTLW